MERPVDPDLVDVLEAREAQLLSDFDCAIPARVQSYDAAMQVADLIPLLRRPVIRPDGSTAWETDPVVPSVPVQWTRSSGWAITLALAPGDTGLLLCCDGDLSAWRAGSGDVASPVNLQRHHLSHAVFVPGLHRRAAPLASAASGTAAMALGSDGTGPRVILRTTGDLEVSVGGTVRLRVAADGTVHLGASVATSLVALASLVETRLDAIQTWANLHTHTAAPGGGPTSPPIAPLTGVNAVAATRVRAT